MARAAEVTLDSLLEFVNQARGFDFTGYKRPSIQRRVAKRMSEAGVESYDEYIDYLQVHPEEFASLFNTILINVTGFFRDPQTWEFLASGVVPELIGRRPPEAPIRAWCAGCASGEEPYTLAMVLARALGEKGFQDRVKIYGTDVDEQALDTARHGAYTPRQIEDVPREALERFFERTEQRYVFRKDLRRCVVFGRNDLVRDAPISRIDLLLCRNALMYFTAETQAQILGRFHFALDNDGILLLGKSEMLITHADLFTPVDLKRRIFRKVVVRTARRERTRFVPYAHRDGALENIGQVLRETAFDVGTGAHLVVDAERSLVMANDQARRTFDLGVGDLGRPIQDLEVSYRPLELRPRLDAVVTDLSGIEVSAVRWETRTGQEHYLNVRITPLVSDGELIGTSISYGDITDTKKLQEQLMRSKLELEQAYEELQSTVEELETTNEELQSTNEELETTNEELQSMNEELETMNEELHSANEELETMNEELRTRSSELTELNTFLETILGTVGLAVAVLDRDQRVQVWNGQAYEMWGLGADEVEGQHLLGLDFGLPVEPLKPYLRSILAATSSHEEVVLEATSRRGRSFNCQVTCLPLREADGDPVSGVIVMMEDASDGAVPSS
ncbi:MAG: PAS domain-containing protein [Solirubrobacterales bacterium]|nr:PAS domain-containing protein [Solirubrobacterales bacterium]